jgi:hypothetical protein
MREGRRIQSVQRIVGSARADAKAVYEEQQNIFHLSFSICHLSARASHSIARNQIENNK